MLDDMIFALVAGTAEEALTDAMWEKRGRDARAEGRVLGALRVRHSEATGLSRHWRVREVTPSARAIAYELSRVDLVEAVRRLEPLRWRERIGLPIPGDAVTVLHLRSTGVKLDWVIATEDAERALGRLELPPA